MDSHRSQKYTWKDFRSTIMDGISIQITCNIFGGRVFDPNVSEVLDDFSFQLMSNSTVFNPIASWSHYKILKVTAFSFVNEEQNAYSICMASFSNNT